MFQGDKKKCFFIFLIKIYYLITVIFKIPTTIEGFHLKLLKIENKKLKEKTQLYPLILKTEIRIDIFK